jgi:hypothetical protein
LFRGQFARRAEVNGDFCRDEFRFAFRQSDFAETAASNAVDKGIAANLLTGTKHQDL